MRCLFWTRNTNGDYTAAGFRLTPLKTGQKVTSWRIERDDVYVTTMPRLAQAKQRAESLAQPQQALPTIPRVPHEHSVEMTVDGRFYSTTFYLDRERLRQRLESGMTGDLLAGCVAVVTRDVTDSAEGSLVDEVRV